MSRKSVGCLATLFFTLASAAADTKDLEKRIEDLERQQAELFLQINQDQNRVAPFLPSEIRLGGFFQTGLRYGDGPRTKAQTNAAPHVLGINIAGQISPRDRFVGQVQSGIGYNFVNPHADPRYYAGSRRYTTSTATTIMVHAYYEHTFSEALNVQAGTGYVPFGIAYHYREPLLLRRRGGDAQMVQQSASVNQGQSSVGVAFPLWMGVHAHGSKKLIHQRFGYNLYTTSPTTNSKKLGYGSRAWYELMEALTIGASAQVGKLQTEDTYRSFGGDIAVKIGRYGFNLEYAESTVSNDGPSPRSYYATSFVEFADGQFLFYLGADFLDNPTQLVQNSAVTFAAAPYERWDYYAGINWLPHSNLRFRLGYTDHKYMGTGTFGTVEPEDRNYYDIDASMVIAF